MSDQSHFYKVIIIGTGFSGLAAAIKLKERGITDFVMLEKADDLGGTWRDNTYPGAECDIPSALYSFSFEPYPYWEYKWSHQDQILSYIRHCATTYDLDQHIRYKHHVSSMIWADDRWAVILEDGRTIDGRHVILAIGQLHIPKIPKISGQSSFTGQSFHSAKWDHHVSLEGKRIGVIGNAASAIQLIPELAKIAKIVVVFQRSANWILPKQDRQYYEWEKSLVKRWPILLRLYRLKLWLMGGALYLMMTEGHQWLRSIYQHKVRRYIKRHVDDLPTIEALIPSYPMGAKRVLFSDEYYASLAMSHVHLETTSILSIDETGIQVVDQHHALDIIVYATGFHTNPLYDHIHICGSNSQTLKDTWQNGPIHYLGIHAPDFPNLHMMYGPHTNLGHNSIIIMAEAQAAYIAQMIHDRGDHTISVRHDTAKRYTTEMNDRLSKMIWAKLSDSWYTDDQGRIPNNWPGRTIEYMHRTKAVDWRAYHISR